MAWSSCWWVDLFSFFQGVIGFLEKSLTFLTCLLELVGNKKRITYKVGLSLGLSELSSMVLIITEQAVILSMGEGRDFLPKERNFLECTRLN